MRFLLFIIAVIAIGAGTIKLKQKNRQVMKNTLKEGQISERILIQP